MEIDWYPPAAGKFGEKAIKVITDKKTISQLASYFPGMGNGTRSKNVGGWVPEFILTFQPAKGEPVTILVSPPSFAPDPVWWSEYHGDWELDPAKGKELEKLIESVVNESVSS